MSGDMLPIIEQLADAADDDARAAWLLACPYAVLLKYEVQIRNLLRAAGFEMGIAYLAAVLAKMREVRPIDGDVLVRMLQHRKALRN